MGWKLLTTSQFGFSYRLVEETEEDITITKFMNMLPVILKKVSAFCLNKRNREKNYNEEAWISSKQLHVGFKEPFSPTHIHIHNMGVIEKPRGNLFIQRNVVHIRK